MATIHDVLFHSVFTPSGWAPFTLHRNQFEVSEAQIPLLMRHPLTSDLDRNIGGAPNADEPWIPNTRAAASEAVAVFRFLLTPAGWQQIATEANYGPDKYTVR